MPVTAFDLQRLGVGLGIIITFSALAVSFALDRIAKAIRELKENTDAAK